MPKAITTHIGGTQDYYRNLCTQIATAIIVLSQEQKISFAEIDERIGWKEGTTDEKFGMIARADKESEDSFRLRDISDIIWAIGGYSIKFENNGGRGFCFRFERFE